MTSAAPAAPSPLPHDAVMQLVLLFDVGMVGASPLAAFAVIAAEDGGQLLLGQSVGRQRDGAFLRQAPAVLLAQEGKKHRRQLRRREAFLSSAPILAKIFFFNIALVLLMYV